MSWAEITKALNDDLSRTLDSYLIPGNNMFSALSSSISNTGSNITLLNIQGEGILDYFDIAGGSTAISPISIYIDDEDPIVLNDVRGITGMISMNSVNYRSGSTPNYAPANNCGPAGYSTDLPYYAYSADRKGTVVYDSGLYFNRSLIIKGNVNSTTSISYAGRLKG